MRGSEIAHLWQRVNRQLYERLRETAQLYDLTPVSYQVIRHIERAPGITLSDLARSISSAKGHTSTIVEQLARAGLVEKRTDPSDQRLIRLHLTDRARETLEQMNRRSESIWSDVFAGFSDEELEQFARTLRTLWQVLEAMNNAERRSTV